MTRYIVCSITWFLTTFYPVESFGQGRSGGYSGGNVSGGPGAAGGYGVGGPSVGGLGTGAVKGTTGNSSESSNPSKQTLPSEIAERLSVDGEFNQTLKVLREKQLRERANDTLIDPPSKLISGEDKGAIPIPRRRRDQEQGKPDDIGEKVYISVAANKNGLICANDDESCKKSVNNILAGKAGRVKVVREDCMLPFQTGGNAQKFMSVLNRDGRVYAALNPTGKNHTEDSPRQLVSTNEMKDLMTYAEKCYDQGLSTDESNFIGIFIDISENQLIGMGTLVGPSIVITASHVLYKTDIQGNPSGLRSLQHVRFRLAKNPEKEFSITGLNDDLPAKLKNFSSQDRDISYVILAEKITPAEPFPELIELPNEEIRLRIPGFSLALFQSAVGTGIAKDANEWKYWTSYVVADTKEACTAILHKDNGCILHGCSTFAGMSGAGVFLKRESTSDKPLRLVGIHGGALVPGSTCDTPSYQLPSLNVASKVKNENHK